VILAVGKMVWGVALSATLRAVARNRTRGQPRQVIELEGHESKNTTEMNGQSSG